MLTREIAETIVKETMTRLSRNINIMDESGTIIASGDTSRLNQVHEGALEVIWTGKPLIITSNNKDQWNGALVGINLPIELRNKIVGVIGITGEPQEVEEFGGLVKMTTELILKQAYLVSQLEWKQRTIEMTIEELIKPEPRVEWIDERLHLLQIRLHPPFNVCILEIHERTIRNQELIQQIEEMISENHPLVGFLSVNKLFILMSGLSDNKVQKKLERMQEMILRMGIQFRIGYAAQVHELGKISFAYKESELALAIGDDDQQLIPYSIIETKALVYLMDETVRKRYVSRVFPSASPKVIESLQAFFDSNLNITEAAKALYVHRNTLIYRIKKIKNDTGYDPQIFNEAIPLQIAIWMYQKEESSPPVR